MNHASESRARWTDAASSAVFDRWTLLCNHVLRSEPRATERLAVHAGRTLCFDPAVPRSAPAAPSWLPNLMPDVGPAWWTVTKAGLLERLPTEPAAQPLAGVESGADGTQPEPGTPPRADVRIGLRAASPWDHARAFATGDVGVFEVQGDGPVAADVRWILDNVRWDIAGDVGRVMPAPLQAPAAKLADAVANGLRSGARTLDAWWPRSGDRSSSR